MTLGAGGHRERHRDRAPRLSKPQNSQFLRPILQARVARRAALLSIDSIPINRRAMPELELQYRSLR